MITFPALIWDTETTGLPDFRKPADDPCQPRMVAMAASLIEVGNKPLATFECIIRPDGWTIPVEVARIHGITTEIAMERGVPLAKAIDAFMELFDRAEVHATYGMLFDEKIRRGECRRLGRPDRFGEKPEVCVMRTLTPICNLPPSDKMAKSGRLWPKTPTLTEAVSIILGVPHEKAHDAAADVEMTARLYDWLAERGHLNPKVRPSNAGKPVFRAKGGPGAGADEVI